RCASSYTASSFEGGEMKIATMILIAGLTLSISGCESQVVDDLGISAKVKSNLAASNDTSAIKIGVDTTNRVVTLSGVVPTEREKARAEQIAASTEGVARVVNNLTVNPNTIAPTNIGEKAQVAVDNAAIQTKIEAKLLTEGITGVNIIVSNGTVTLKGQ